VDDRYCGNNTKLEKKKKKKNHLLKRKKNDFKKKKKIPLKKKKKTKIKKKKFPNKYSKRLFTVLVKKILFRMFSYFNISTNNLIA